ncbi:MAG: hypothetical protein GY723_17550 [bacterium]|nr:hypothetical protein [bacterium]MCP5071229.1 hypothetical protein [bacterium]
MPSLPTLFLIIAVATATRLENGTVGQIVALMGAFWVGLLEFEHRGGKRRHALHFVAGMGAGALACHLGWALLHPDHPADPLRRLFAPAGFCVLFAPVGVALTSPRLAGERGSYLAPALGSLPLALATARLGCLAVGCCHGVALRSGLAPTQVLEIIGCGLLSIGSRWLPPAKVPAVTLAGLGCVRLIIEPWRAPDPVGPPVLPMAAVAALLVAVGCFALLIESAKRPAS